MKKKFGEPKLLLEVNFLISQKSEYDLIEQSIYNIIRCNGVISLGEVVYIYTNLDSECRMTDEESLLFVLSDMYNKNLIKYETITDEEKGFVYTKLSINNWDKNFIGDTWDV